MEFESDLEICAVCLNNFSINDVISLDCNHIFHKYCIYLLRNNKCPVCRACILDISSKLSETSDVVCCYSRCSNGYTPFVKNGECRYCYGKPFILE